MECDSSALASRVGIKPDESTLTEKTVQEVCVFAFYSTLLLSYF